MTYLSPTLITILLLALLLYGAILIRNGLVKKRNQYLTLFAQIDTELTRRYDLIPNLVEVAKGYMQHEQETLTAVVNARNGAAGSFDTLKKNLNDPTLNQLFNSAEGALNSSLGRLMAVVEGYPELRANEQMMQLSTELSRAEERIATLRKHYNFSIEEYNNYRSLFPNILISHLLKYPEMPWLKAEEVKRSRPNVKF